MNLNVKELQILKKPKELSDVFETIIPKVEFLSKSFPAKIIFSISDKKKKRQVIKIPNSMSQDHHLVKQLPSQTSQILQPLLFQGFKSSKIIGFQQLQFKPETSSKPISIKKLFHLSKKQKIKGQFIGIQSSRNSNLNSTYKIDFQNKNRSDSRNSVLK